jgi:hypothetical protein
MFRGRSSVIIHQPVEVVFAILPFIGTNPGARFTSIQQIPEGSIGIGTRFSHEAGGTGGISIVTEITEYEPNQRITLQQDVAGCLRAKAIGRYSLEPAADGTIVTLVAEMKATGWFWPVLEFFRLPGMTALALKTNLNKLKERIEAQALLPGGYHISGPLPAFNARQLPPEEGERQE